MSSKAIEVAPSHVLQMLDVLSHISPSVTTFGHIKQRQMAISSNTACDITHVSFHQTDSFVLNALRTVILYVISYHFTKTNLPAVPEISAVPCICRFSHPGQPTELTNHLVLS